MRTQLSLFLHFYLLYLRHQRLEAAPHYHKTLSTKLLVNGESGYMHV